MAKLIGVILFAAGGLIGICFEIAAAFIIYYAHSIIAAAICLSIGTAFVFLGWGAFRFLDRIPPQPRNPFN